MQVKVEKKNSSPFFGVPGVGKQIAKMLTRLEIFSPRDLMLHLPLRYQNKTQIQGIRQLIPNEEAVIEGIVSEISTPPRGKTKLLCVLKDDTGSIILRFFNVYAFQKTLLKPGTRIRCYGMVRLTRAGKEMAHPECKLVSAENPPKLDEHLTPVYPTTEGLHQNVLRKISHHALQLMDQTGWFKEILPPPILQNFPPLNDAIKFIHRPPAQTPIELLAENKTPAQQRLSWEELLAHRLSLLEVKKTFQLQKSHALPRTNTLIAPFLRSLPFSLTAAQQRVTDEISQDLRLSYPMLRLVQGDVGSGKTVVAALAMLHAVEHQQQAVLMAPTELLAEQHYRTFSQWMQTIGVTVAFLSGNIKGAARNKVLAQIESGDAQLVIGTHALFQEQVRFAKLALIVIDEQHRFGVQQRALLRSKGMSEDYCPHQLVMTATPIPRTLAMSFYADLDCSAIDELPPGRTPVMTRVIASQRREEIIAHIRKACLEGRQVFWVCPLIDESENLSCEAAIETAETLQSVLPELKVALIHGRMKAAEKEIVMRAFQEKETHLLVATTVIEVGVDVPNASIMIIENAERLGLSQLHQLRGRVGRGAVASHCILLYHHLSEMAKKRLDVMRQTNDGFKIAQFDLELRGPGEVLGTKQTGAIAFKVADLVRDSALLGSVQAAADKMMQEYPALIPAIIERWVGQGKDYSKV